MSPALEAGGRGETGARRARVREERSQPRAHPSTGSASARAGDNKRALGGRGRARQAGDSPYSTERWSTNERKAAWREGRTYVYRRAVLVPPRYD